MCPHPLSWVLHFCTVHTTYNYQVDKFYEHLKYPFPWAANLKKNSRTRKVAPRHVCLRYWIYMHLFQCVGDSLLKNWHWGCTSCKVISFLWCELSNNLVFFMTSQWCLRTAKIKHISRKCQFVDNIRTLVWLRVQKLEVKVSEHVFRGI